MMEFTIYGIGFFLCTLLIQYMLFKVRKNHNHGPNGIWVGNRAILGFIFADEAGKAAGWH